MELKPCPFCGRIMAMTVSNDNSCYGFFHADKYIRMNDECECPVGLGAFIHRVSKEKAIEIWNRRADNEAV